MTEWRSNAHQYESVVDLAFIESLPDTLSDAGKQAHERMMRLVRKRLAEIESLRRKLGEGL